MMNGSHIILLTAAGCTTGIALYHMRKRMLEKRKRLLKEVLSDGDTEQDFSKDIVYTNVAPDQSDNTRKLTWDGCGNTIIVVGVCGGTGSGKTTLSRAIVKRFGEERVTYLCHDYYYKDLRHLNHDQRSKHNFDHPGSLDTELLVEHLRELKTGKTVDIPVYDFSTHSRLDERRTLSPNRVILVEGILIYTHPELVDLMDIKIFVETPADIRFIRRLKRDIEERGRTAVSVMHQYMKTVRPMHLTFVEPSKTVADIIIPQGVNAVALDMIISRLRSFTARSD